jgi:hypothetical protein
VERGFDLHPRGGHQGDVHSPNFRFSCHNTLTLHPQGTWFI